MELYGENYPVTVANFIQNIEKDIYDKKNFYKIISYPQVQIIHSGIYKRDSNGKGLNEKKLYLPLEIKLQRQADQNYGYQITEPSIISNLKNNFEKGSLAMVKSGESNSSSTEFFFVTNKFPELNGRFTVFGKIVKGIEVLQNLEVKDFIQEIIILD